MTVASGVPEKGTSGQFARGVAEALFTGPSASRRHLFNAHDHGRLRSN